MEALQEEVVNAVWIASGLNEPQICLCLVIQADSRGTTV
jgi:hypothetical protein